MAIVPPPQPSSQQQALVPAGETNPLQEILRVLAETRDAAEQETQRRIAWEQATEAKHAQERTELERRLMDMQAELSILKSQAHQPPLPPPQPHQPQPEVMYPKALPPPNARDEGFSSPSSDGHADQPAPPTPASQLSFTSPSSPFPNFIQGSSSRPTTASSPFPLSPRQLPSPVTPHIPSLPTPRPSQPPSTSPIASFNQPATFRISLDGTRIFTPQSTPSMLPNHPPVTSPMYKSVPPPSPSVQKSIKRGAPGSDGENPGSDEEDDGPDAKRRRNTITSQCSTIQQAVRAHIHVCMGIGYKDPLPEGHIEGADLPDDQPVRFVWGKTARQSPHNMAMKNRILNDLRANKHFYHQVPPEDYTDLTMDNSFDQTFKTLRSKFKIQNDEAAAAQNKAREEMKVIRSRRRERKKNKLKKRADTRKRIDALSHSTFEQALTQECMSSEESSDEFEESVDAAGAIVNIPILRIHGFAWRSSRLTHFYAVLDADDDGARPRKPTNGKRRQAAAPRDEAALPPEGVGSWMISRRWMKKQEMARPGFRDALQGRINDTPNFDWSSFDMLGVESGDELDLSQEDSYTA